MLTTHINRVLATAGITGTLLAGAWIGATAANAQPAFCDTDMYITACAGGGGGGGGFIEAPGCQGTSHCVALNKTWRAANPGEDLPDNPN